jgi:hypothetical protein
MRDPGRCRGICGHQSGLAMSRVGGYLASKPARPGDGPASAVADAFLDSWVSWREASEDVRTAYRCWSECAIRHRDLAFAVYRAALDREEHTASIHSYWAERAARTPGP